MTSVAGTALGREEIYDKLKGFEGQPSGPASRAPDPVNQPMIRHWVEAMGDENPVYLDEEAARVNGFNGVVAPPTMLQAWIMGGYRATVLRDAAREDAAAGRAGTPLDALFGLLDQAGFTSVVATNCEQEYRRPLELGDLLTVRSVIESVSPEKATGLGDGHFVTTRLDFTDQNDELVATMRFRILRFRPRPPAVVAADGAPGGDKDVPGTTSSLSPENAPAGNAAAGNATAGNAAAGNAAADKTTPGEAAAPAPEAPKRPRPAITHDNAFFFEGARQGRLLVQRCSSCSQLRHPPRPCCPLCRSFDWEPAECSGRGNVYSYVIVHHPQVPGFEYPLPIAVVELEEGPRLVADLVHVEPSHVTISMPVVCEFVAVDDELTLPMFRPA